MWIVSGSHRLLILMSLTRGRDDLTVALISRQLKSMHHDGKCVMGDELGRADLCPSAPARPGALVIGIRGEDGSVHYLRDRLSVDEEFLSRAEQRGDPEQRFRFSSPCQQHACQQWADGQCSLPARLSELLEPTESFAPLPRCAIRAHCRWYAQSGHAACHICPLVSTRESSMRARPTGGDNE
jgi:hypothetical protein